MVLENYFERLLQTEEKMNHIETNTLRHPLVMPCQIHESVYSHCFLSQVEKRIFQMAEDPPLSKDVRTALFLDVSNMLTSRIDLADRAIQNFTLIKNAYANGKRIFGYRYLNDKKSNLDHIVPKPLLKYALSHNRRARKGADLDKYIGGFKDRMLIYQQLANESYYNFTADQKEIHQNNIMFLNRGRTFYWSKSQLYIDVLNYPAEVLEEKIADFVRKWKTFEEAYSKMKIGLDGLERQLDALDETIFSKLNEGLNASAQYMIDETISKAYVANLMTADSMFDGINLLKVSVG